MKARNAVCKRDSRVEFFEHVGLDLPAEDTNDFVEYFVSEIERYTPDEALKIIRGRCGKAEGFNAIVLGGVLKKTLLNNWYKDYGYQ
jgi:hypothetical protein